MQGLGKYFPAARNTHATIEGLLDGGLYTRSVLYEILRKGKVIQEKKITL
jgi:hypothetical protein